MSSGAEHSIQKVFSGVGTRDQVSTSDLWVKSYMVQPNDENQAIMAVGGNTLDLGSKVWYAWLPIPSTKAVETFNNSGPYTSSFNLKDLYVEGAIGEGCTITYNLF